MNKQILKIIDKISFIYKKSGVNYPLMRKILKLKLTLDTRRSTTILNNNTTKKTEGKNLFLSSLIYYAIFGIILGLFIIKDMPIFNKMGIFFTMNIVFLTFILISDFSTVLLDTLDKKIFLTKLIDEKTYNAAKLTHIFIYFFLITISINFLALIVGAFKYGVIFFIMYLLQLILINILSIFITSILYFIILKIFDGEKLKDIINMFQILFTITIMVGYQILVRSFSFIEVANNTSPKIWNYIMPSYWFAAPYALIFDNTMNNVSLIILTILSVALPIILLIIYMKVISKKFESYIIKLDNNVSVQKNKLNKRFSLHNSLLSIICRSKEERIFAKFALIQFSKERKLKLNIYPNLALGIVLPIIFTFNYIDFDNFSISALQTQLHSSKMYLFIYYTILMFIAIIQNYKYSESYEGAWIYNTLPIKDMSVIFKAVYKSFIIKFILPNYLLISIVLCYFYGIHIIIDLLICFIIILFTSMIFFKLFRLELPFSLDFNGLRQSKNIGIMFLSMCIIGVMAGIHYLISKNIIYQLILLVVYIICLFISYKKVFIYKVQN